MQRYYGMNSSSSSAQAGPVPVSGAATASLDLNASCSRIDAAATTATGRPDGINKQAATDSDEEEGSKFETPVKAVANMEMLRALRLLDKQDDDDEIVHHSRPLLRYPAHLSKAPSNETDHRLGQGPATASTRAGSSAADHSTGDLPESDSMAPPAMSAALEQDQDFQDRQRLAREISQDMDQGGYASLEQILARNGFQVCRVATPPSSGAARLRSRATHSHLEDPSQHHHATSSTQSGSSANIADTSTTAIVAGDAGGNSTAGGLETRAQTTTVTTNSKTIPPCADARHGILAQKISGSHPLAKALSNSTQSSGTNGTQNQSVRIKPSLMSFTGLVSSLWGGGGASTTTVPIHPQSGAQNVSEAALPPSPISPAGVDSADSSRDMGEEGPTSIDRDEHIKGWLRQTVEATNQYMSEAKRQIEAARLAMGSPEAVRSHPSKLDRGENDVTHKAFVSHLPESSTDGTVEMDLSHPGREGTQSTIESEPVETPTTSPADVASRTYDVRVVHSPLSSPPLLRQQLRQDMAPHLVDAVACDSPLRQRALLARQNKAQQDQESQRGLRETQYPPRDARAHIQDSGSGGKKEERPRSAETLLRGTLRHALSEALMRATQTPQVEQAPPAQLPRHPSIASIFGIPLARTAAQPPVQVSQGAENVNTSDNRARPARPNVVRSDSNQLSESTNSLSTETASSRAARSSSAAQTASTAPKLLRKTASKHTLRKAASPVLSTTAVESYADAAEMPSPAPPVDVVPVSAAQKKQEQQRSHVAVYQDSPDRTPVKTRAVRGPIPASSTTRTNTAADETSSTPSRTPRQVAHRNPRDNPVGETRVVKSPPGKRFASVLSNSRNVNVLPHQVTGSPARKKASVGSIMDDENEGSGMWTPPSSKTAPRKTVPEGDVAAKKRPLGETRHTKQHGNDSNGVAVSQKPRLKAKQSLEHILAAQQVQAALKTDKTAAEAVPPVPIVPFDLQSKGTTKDAELPTRSLKKGASNDGVDRADKSTTSSRAGFTSTLRGFFGSATNTLAQNAVTFSTLRGPREAPSHVSKPTHQLRHQGAGAPVIRRAKSMYARPGSTGAGDRPPKDSWPSAQERYSLILPTIIISEPTNDSDALSF